ncbi:hypothetical protein [Amaricoccus solimangrovi]|uniref:DUF3168 domain-containing protein n=1 Tax=Amaricoccus solimangrovi TaxID=2589815 RepID=A0A501WS71_9RHOB|nr:hypothetical protein [Amaricoccus solimangrovi]TPE52583.1 hypothetical protein FJM51_05235 [Amaricoccus solimangrovi]
MSVRSQIFGAVRSRLALNLTGALDLTGSPFPAPSARLPAYAIRIAEQSAEPADMGSNWLIVRDRLTLHGWAEGDQSLAPAMLSFAGELRDLMLAAPVDLGGLAESITPAGLDVAQHAGERRVLGCEVAFDLLYLEAPPAAPIAGDAGAFSAGFSLGFLS